MRKFFKLKAQTKTEIKTLPFSNGMKNDQLQTCQIVSCGYLSVCIVFCNILFCTETERDGLSLIQ